MRLMSHDWVSRQVGEPLGLVVEVGPASLLVGQFLGQRRRHHGVAPAEAKGLLDLTH